jgi:hypothetical protein
MIKYTVWHTLPGMDYKKYSIDRMVAATEHIRECERCRRVYGVGFDIVLEAYRKELPTMYIEYPPPFRVLEQCFRELHQCEHWPKGI